jgi:hypothetical protein|tara:strand:+ start:153 stop:392 length:240 start_codon:yes stop_codon:yes gene_type:complete
MEIKFLEIKYKRALYDQLLEGNRDCIDDVMCELDRLENIIRDMMLSFNQMRYSVDRASSDEPDFNGCVFEKVGILNDRD